MCSDTNGFGCSDCWSGWYLKKNKISPSGCFFIATTVSSHCVLLKDCKLSFFKSAFIEVQDSFVRVSDLEILVDNPWRPSFPWESVSLSVNFLLQKDSSLEMSVDDLLKIARYLRVKNLEMCPQFCFGDCIWCLQLGTGLREIHLSCPNHCFCRTTCTWRHFTSTNRSSTPKTESNFERKTFNYLYLGSGICHQSFDLVHQQIRYV